MRTRQVLAAIVAAFAIFATAIRAQTPPIVMEGYPTVGSPPVVTVLSPGAAPLKPLRYVVSADQKMRITMAMTMGMTMQVGQQSMPMDMPTMKMDFEVVVKKVAADGDIDYEFACTGLDVEAAPGTDPGLVAAMRAGAGGITSLKGSATVSSRGVTRSAKFDVSDPMMKQALSQMQASLENMSMPLPEEPVGVGAKWEVRQALSTGQTIFQKTVYELTSMEGSALSLSAMLEQTAPPQAVNNPALPSGAGMRLEKMSGSGRGTIAIRLDSLMPTSEVQLTSSSVMSMTIEGQPQSITADVKLKLSIAPTKP